MSDPSTKPKHDRETAVSGIKAVAIQESLAEARRAKGLDGYPPLTRSNVAAIIPAYQAEATIGPVATQTAKEVRRVIVVDDGSSDGTYARALRGTQARDHLIEVVRHPANLGKGAALRTGIQHLLEDAEIDAVITLDADGQHLPSEIGKLIDASNDADLVLGSRCHLFSDMSWLRRFANRSSARGISLVAGHRLADVQTGFRLYRRGLLERLPLAEDRFEAESAVVVRAARGGFVIRSVSVDLAEADGRSTSHYRPLMDSLRIALGVIAARALGPVTGSVRSAPKDGA